MVSQERYRGVSDGIKEVRQYIGWCHGGQKKYQGAEEYQMVSKESGVVSAKRRVSDGIREVRKNIGWCHGGQKRYRVCRGIRWCHRGQERYLAKEGYQMTSWVRQGIISWCHRG